VIDAHYHYRPSSALRERRVPRETLTPDAAVIGPVFRW
jgi:hypothetical protein